MSRTGAEHLLRQVDREPGKFLMSGAANIVQRNSTNLERKLEDLVTDTHGQGTPNRDGAWRGREREQKRTGLTTQAGLKPAAKRDGKRTRD